MFIAWEWNACTSLMHFGFVLLSSYLHTFFYVRTHLNCDVVNRYYCNILRKNLFYYLARHVWAKILKLHERMLKGKLGELEFCFRKVSLHQQKFLVISVLSSSPWSEAAPAQNEWGGGTKWKNLKTMVKIFVVCGIRNAAYFFYAESLVHSRYNYKKISCMVDSERVCDFVGRCREKKSQCRMTDVGV